MLGEGWEIRRWGMRWEVVNKNTVWNKTVGDKVVWNKIWGGGGRGKEVRGKGDV